MALTLSVDLPASAPAQIYVNAVFGSRNDRIQNGEHNKFICLKLEGTTRRAFTFPDASAQEVRKVRPWGRIYRDPRTHYRLELFVSRHKVLSRVNGQVLYHGPHNQEIDEVFPSLLLCGDENLLRSSGVTVRIENISVRRCPMPQSEGMSTEEF